MSEEMSDILDSILNKKKYIYNWTHEEISLNENKIIGTDHDCHLNNFLGILLSQELFFFSYNRENPKGHNITRS